MQINKNLAISESGFIFNPSSGDSFSTNQVGREILKKMQANTDKKKLLVFITDTFSVDQATAEKDLTDFVMMLEMHEIIVNQ